MTEELSSVNDLKAKLAEEIQYNKEQEAENLQLTARIAMLEQQLAQVEAVLLEEQTRADRLWEGLKKATDLLEALSSKEPVKDAVHNAMQVPYGAESAHYSGIGEYLKATKETVKATAMSEFFEEIEKGKLQP